ncbi:methionine sulfoxide reductase A isoform X2 [Arctopsyche grandis]|uniref:methionine sulfoxide reductase A isoform X2 n=1 Tax=Arctopsyche grandis TaxID=121162 RepID=UPI00406D7EA6
MLNFFSKFSTKMKPPNGLVPRHHVDVPVKKATFGMGCFWSNDSLFGARLGVVRTRVGYAGGTAKTPYYRNIGDHTEVIEIDYDPKQISFGELLDMFWNNHEYGLTSKIKRQYMSLILYHDDEQKELAESTYKTIETERNVKLRTEIAPAGPFYPAEDYHQKYRLQGHKDFCKDIGLHGGEMLHKSHLAARLNGYLVGVGGLEQFEKELESLGLNEKQAEYVKRELKRNEGGGLAC